MQCNYHYLIVDHTGIQRPLVLVTYKFDGVPEHKVLVKPHGNAKSNRPYCRTMASTKSQLQEELKSLKPKQAVHKVSHAKGGLLKASSSGELPLSQQQAYNINYKCKMANVGNSRGTGRDLLYVVMEQCKQSEKVNRYVQEVTCAPEPMAILATGQQLFDIERFCCDANEYCVMGIDPTFNLGEFSVTPIVYQNLIVIDKKSGKSPWLLGPILIHYKKEFRNYNFFLSSLIGLNKKLAYVKAVGTDGEVNLIESVEHQFRSAILLRCFRHLQANIERHLQGKKISNGSVKCFVQEIFGWTDADGARKSGLVDCYSEEDFYEALTGLKEKWIEREQQDLSPAVIGEGDTFYDWFVRYKAVDFCKGTLVSIREGAGLGSPPAAYYTNPNEAINSAIKNKTNYKKQQLPLFIESMKELVDQQQEEVEKAIVGGGKYSIGAAYKSYEVMDGRWWRPMTEAQRIAHIKKFNCQTLKRKEASAVHVEVVASTSKSLLPSVHVLSVSCEDAIKYIKLSQPVVSGIWQKANILVSDTSCISTVPGGSGKDKFVLSRSGNLPHLVKCHDNIYRCGDSCLNFKSIGICSHTVAAAESNHELSLYLTWYEKNKASKPTNLFQLAKHGMPAGAGCKGGKPKRSRRKASSAQKMINAELIHDSSPSVQYTVSQSTSSTSMQMTQASQLISSTSDTQSEPNSSSTVLSPISAVSGNPSHVSSGISYQQAPIFQFLHLPHLSNWCL